MDSATPADNSDPVVPSAAGRYIQWREPLAHLGKERPYVADRDLIFRQQGRGLPQSAISERTSAETARRWQFPRTSTIDQPAGLMMIVIPVVSME